jgi:hypothetical protein
VNVELEWKKIPESLPPFDKEILAINKYGIIVQTRRKKDWDARWTGKRTVGKSGSEIIWWQYWTELPKVPKTVGEKYEQEDN